MLKSRLLKSKKREVSRDSGKLKMCVSTEKFTYDIFLLIFMGLFFYILP